MPSQSQADFNQINYWLIERTKISFPLLSYTHTFFPFCCFIPNVLHVPEKWHKPATPPFAMPAIFNLIITTLTAVHKVSIDAIALIAIFFYWRCKNTDRKKEK